MIPSMSRHFSSLLSRSHLPRRPGVATLLTWMIAIVTGLALHGASPDTAQQAYKKGDFQKARREYDALVQGQPDDPRYQFNAGAAAYRTYDFTNAANRFEATLASPDLKLQEKAYYNLGNTRYQLGFRAPDPQAKLKQWQQAVTDYNSALKLDATDTNAASNLQFVKSKVEELMRQQPPSQRQKNQDKNQDQDKDKDKDKKEQDPSQDSKSDKDKDQEKKQQDAQQKQSKDDPSKSDPKEPQDGNPDKKDGQDQAQNDAKKQEQESKSGQKQDGKDGKDAGQKPEGKDGKGQAIGMEEGKAGEMSQAQAAKLLDEQKGDEKALIFQPGGQGKRPRDPSQRSRKTW